jgi:hypothetical protein
MKYFTPKKNYEVFYSVRTQYMVWVGELGRNTYVDTYHTYHTHTHTHTHTPRAKMRPKSSPPVT